MYNNNYSKFEKNFINKGLIINKVEKKNALIYINEVIKKNLIKILKLNIKTKNFDLNKLHIYINERNINSVRLRLINAINKDTNFRNFF